MISEYYNLSYRDKYINNIWMKQKEKEKSKNKKKEDQEEQEVVIEEL